MNEGQGQSGQLEGISRSIVMSMSQDNTLKNKKVKQKNSKKRPKFRYEFQGH